MFGIDSAEFILCAVIALVVIGPKDLPKAMRFIGHWVGKARGMARHFRTGFDTMVREAELDELEKKWATENERIKTEFPPESFGDDPGPTLPSAEMLPLAPPSKAAAEIDQAVTPKP